MSSFDISDKAHDQYVDYSCSTSIERLGRDIETVLHKWHVNNGSDRHFTSITRRHSYRRAGSDSVLSVGTDSEDKHATINASGTSALVSTPTGVHRATVVPVSSALENSGPLNSIARNPLLIRREILKWHISFSTTASVSGNPQKVSADIPLELSLWDGPHVIADDRSKQTQQQNAFKGNGSSNSTIEAIDGLQTADLLLPYSLQRKANDGSIEAGGFTDSVDDLFSNFSCMFGIGQHISISPLHPEDPFYYLLQKHPEAGIDSSMKLDINSSEHSSRGYSDSNSTRIPSTLLEYISHSSIHRHGITLNGNTGDCPSAQANISYVLSNWLQTALNLAASNCHCHFPLFGVWGKYDPASLESPPPTKALIDNSNITGTDNERINIFPSWMSATQKNQITEAAKYLANQDQKNYKEMSFRSTSGVSQSSNEKLDSSVHSTTQRMNTHLQGSVGKKRRQNQVANLSQHHHLNLDNISPLICGKVLSDSCSSTFWLYAIKPDMPLFSGASLRSDKVRWTFWGKLLQHHCLRRKRRLERLDFNSQKRKSFQIVESLDAFVNLWTARHTYCWYKYQQPKNGLQRLIWLGSSTSDTSWRPDILSVAVDKNNKSSNQQRRFIAYRNQCRLAALQRIERAAGASRGEPLWGPPDDPVSSIRAVLTWSGSKGTKSNQTSDNASGGNFTPSKSQPILSLPLKSRHSLSELDQHEMEDATESTVLDVHRPSSFLVSVFFDHNTAHASLAATQRCVLAALIRTTTLPKETLLSHTVDEALMDKWDRSAGNKIAGLLARKACVDSTTVALVAAMDWTTAADDMMEQYEAEDLVSRIFNGPDSSSTSGFPSPPEGFACHLLTSAESGKDTSTTDLLWKPLKKAAPPGRLLSLLCIQMARVRTPCSMALVWMVFCQELRRRWDERESLPNMHFVQGLDPFPSSMRARNGEQSLGNKITDKANLSGFVNSSEPDPDEYHCLLGQKLQVFNIGVESVASSDLYTEANVQNNGLHSIGSSSSESKILEIRNLKNALKPTMETQSACSVDDDSMSTSSDEFFDAPDSEILPVSNFEPRAESLNRKGARCPVQGVSLIETGEQLYAPYLQRPFPLTDDIIAERRVMMTRQTMGNSNAMQRLEVVHRITKPKLLSDIQAFKAANPGSIFEDFVAWYGNPFDQLHDDDEQMKNTGLKASDETKFVYLSETNDMQDHERIFWRLTWDEAEPVPALEQGPLFDADSTVEMALDYLENIHPASLLCQVAGVNLSSAFFALVASAGDTLRVDVVKETLTLLREKIEEALYCLSIDATRATGSLTWHDVDVSNQAEKKPAKSDQIMMASVATLAGCSAACEALGQAEVIVSRAASLLHKFPNQYDLAEQMLRTPEGHTCIVLDSLAQESILSTIYERQQNTPSMSDGDSKLRPAVREYMLRNMDDANPCQLAVRYGDEGMKVCCDSVDSGILLALSLTSVEH